jgi:hypothetical protein
VSDASANRRSRSGDITAAREVLGRGRIRRGRTERGETGLDDGTIKQQRSSGGEKSVEGPLLLPELPRPSGRDTPKITKTSSGKQPRGATILTQNVDLETTVP